MARTGKRASMVGMAAAAVVGALAVPAQASSWSSSLTNVGNDFESRRWTDDGGSTSIKFTSCHRDGTQAVNVTLRKDTFGPDPLYSTATFTNCFNSGATSTGNWDDHGSGDYYFVVDYGQNVYAPVSVSSLSVYY
ncbi:hypothetical protein [Streptomyces mirabilis]|uniref:Beta/Gamma crystallin n=1 Tax=Streptomyces mirabilis TaxID=68239 RepID=A0ABU3V5U1_9ACTN|nr:hypothetical protein [Streptomyces mirabilis]MCX5355899.1 hypothetical protein [Streptomyces mirabilis]MDU9001541.1 hypothetical protein [Streptomyces mirabilis]